MNDVRDGVKHTVRPQFGFANQLPKLKDFSVKLRLRAKHEIQYDVLENMLDIGYGQLPLMMTILDAAVIEST